MQDAGQAFANVDADDAIDESEVPDDAVDPFDDDPPPPFSDRPPEAVVDETIGDTDEEPVDPTEDAMPGHADGHH